MAIRRRMTPKAETEMVKADEPEQSYSATVPIPKSHVAESIESILALLRGLGPTLVGSAPNVAEVQKLLDNLKDPS